jgi:hypothetical protein
MSNITSAKNYIQLQSAQQRSAVSEFLMQTMGGSINWLFDAATAVQGQTCLQFGSIGTQSFGTSSSPFTHTCAAGEVFVAIANNMFSISGSGSFAYQSTGVAGGGNIIIFCANGGSVNLATFSGTGTITYLILNSVTL